MGNTFTFALWSKTRQARMIEVPLGFGLLGYACACAFGVMTLFFFGQGSALRICLPIDEAE